MKQTPTLENAGATVSLQLLVPFLRLLEEETTPELRDAAFDFGERLLTRWGVTRAELEADVRMRLPYDLMVELLVGFVEILGDPSAPLLAGMKLEAGDYELIEYLASSCNTLAESIECVGRYYPLLGPAELELHIEDDRAEARFRLAPGIEAPDSVYEFMLSSTFAMSILHVQLEGIQVPTEVCFTHEAPAHADAFQDIFLVPTRFGCEHNAIVFPADMINQPMAKPDPVLHGVLTRLADHEIDQLIDKNLFPTKVREAIELELRNGATLESVAERLHMSPSTMRSRLQKYGTSYSTLLDRLRREHAKRALRQSDQSISEVAHELGFAHPPAFHRAVRRWFGVTPNEFRDAPGAHPAARFWRKREGA